MQKSLSNSLLNKNKNNTNVLFWEIPQNVCAKFTTVPFSYDSHFRKLKKEPQEHKQLSLFSPGISPEF